MQTFKHDVEPLMSRAEAAHYLGFKASTLSKWDYTKRYNLRPIKVGRRSVRYRRADLDKFLEEYMPTRI